MRSRVYPASVHVDVSDLNDLAMRYCGEAAHSMMTVERERATGAAAALFALGHPFSSESEFVEFERTMETYAECTAQNLKEKQTEGD